MATWGGGGGPVQGSVTQREMRGVRSGGGSATLSCKVNAGETRTGGSSTAWAARAGCSGAARKYSDIFYLFK
jgi:hypothetical protein